MNRICLVVLLAVSFAVAFGSVVVAVAQPVPEQLPQPTPANPAAANSFELRLNGQSFAKGPIPDALLKSGPLTTDRVEYARELQPYLFEVMKWTAAERDKLAREKKDTRAYDLWKARTEEAAARWTANNQILRSVRR